MNTTTNPLDTCDIARKIVAEATLKPSAHETAMDNILEPCEECIMELRFRVLLACGLLPESDSFDERGRFIGSTKVIRDDTPKGDSAHLTRFLQVCNDRWCDEERELLKEFALADLSRKSDEIEWRRLFRCADWAVREIAPKRFEIINRQDLADQFRALDPIVDKARASAAAYAAAAYAADAASAAAYAAAYAADASDAAASAYAAASDASDASDAARKPYIEASLAFIRELIAMGQE